MTDVVEYRISNGTSIEFVLDAFDLRRIGFSPAELEELKRNLGDRVSFGAASDSTRCRQSPAGTCAYGKALSIDWLPNAVLIKFAWTTLPLPACGGSSEGYYWDLSTAKRKMYPGIRPIHGDRAPITPRPIPSVDGI